MLSAKNRLVVALAKFMKKCRLASSNIFSSLRQNSTYLFWAMSTLVNGDWGFQHVVCNERTLGDLGIQKQLSTDQSSGYFHLLSYDVAFGQCATEPSSEAAIIVSIAKHHLNFGQPTSRTALRPLSSPE